LLYATASKSGGDPVNLVGNGYDQYDAYRPMTNLTNPPPRQHDASYNTGYLYRGNVTTQTVAGKTVTRAFDIAGNIVSASDGNLNVSAATGAATNYSAPSTVTPNSSSNLGSSYTFDGSMQLTGVTMPNGATWSQGYSNGMPSTTTSPHGAVTTYAYDFNSTASTIKATTNGHWTRSTLDGLGRTVKVETGDGSGAKSVTESVYGPCACSPMGKVIQVSQPHAPGAAALWTEYTYDARGRTLSIKKPDTGPNNSHSTTTYQYTGNTTKVTDAAGNWKIFTTDALGNLTKVTEPDPNLGNANSDTYYTYNVLNKLTHVSMTRTDPKTLVATTQQRSFLYDDGGEGVLLMSATNPENGKVSYTYNTDGTVLSRTDAKNQRVDYSYDTYKRLTRVHRSDGEDNYTYDAYTGSQNAMGRLAAVTFQGQQVQAPYSGEVIGGTSSFTYIYSYTQAGLVTSKRLRGQFSFSENGSYTAPDLEANYTYDDEGRMTTVGYPLAGPTFTYGYDTMGRMNILSQTAGTSGLGTGQRSEVTWVTYGPAGE
jgi:YD repeat-containing protein